MYKTILISVAILCGGLYLAYASDAANNDAAPPKQKPGTTSPDNPHPDISPTIMPQDPNNAENQAALSKTTVALLSLKTRELYNKYVDLKTLEIMDYNTLIGKLKNIQVIYVAEQHTNTEHHKLQEKILKSLYENNPKTTLAMEFLYRSNQQNYDDYISGKLSEEEFDEIAKKGFGGWYEQYYLSLIRYAKKNGLKLLGLNVEKEIKHKMAVNGWAKLTPEEQKLIAKDIDISNKAHRAYVMRQFEGMMNNPQTKGMFNGPMGDRMYLLQAIWDETFGEAIANYLNAAYDPDIQVVVVLGSGHVSYKFTAPERSYKRYPAKYLTLIPMGIDENTPNKSETLKKLLSSGIGDVIYFAPPNQGE